MHFVFVLSVVLAVIGLSFEDEKKECNITEAQAEECGGQMFVVSNYNFTMPKTEQDIADKCKAIDDGIECFKNYAKNCLDQFSSRILAMVGKNGKKMQDKICKAADTRLEFLNHINCWKSVEAMAPLSLCLDKYIVQMETIGDVKSDDRIPATCCSYHMFKSCLRTGGSKNCDKPESVEYIDGLATGITGDLIKFVCGKYKSIEECDTKMDQAAWTKLKDMVASDDPQTIKSLKKFATPFGALKNILSKFNKA